MPFPRICPASSTFKRITKNVILIALTSSYKVHSWLDTKLLIRDSHIPFGLLKTHWKDLKVRIKI